MRHRHGERWLAFAGSVIVLFWLLATWTTRYFLAHVDLGPTSIGVMQGVLAVDFLSAPRDRFFGAGFAPFETPGNVLWLPSVVHAQSGVGIVVPLWVPAILLVGLLVFVSHRRRSANP